MRLLASCFWTRIAGKLFCGLSIHGPFVVWLCLLPSLHVLRAGTTRSRLLSTAILAPSSKDHNGLGLRFYTVWVPCLPSPSSEAALISFPIGIREKDVAEPCEAKAAGDWGCTQVCKCRISCGRWFAFFEVCHPRASGVQLSECPWIYSRD